MDTVAESNQTLTRCVEAFACAGFGIHCFSPSVADNLGSILETFQAVAFQGLAALDPSPYSFAHYVYPSSYCTTARIASPTRPSPGAGRSRRAVRQAGRGSWVRCHLGQWLRHLGGERIAGCEYSHHE